MAYEPKIERTGCRAELLQRGRPSVTAAATSLCDVHRSLLASSAIASTPIVVLDFGHGLRAQAKLEGRSWAGSHKRRAAQRIVADMVAKGELGQGPATLLLSSSGRAALAFAAATAGVDGVTLIVLSDVLSPARLLAELDRYAHVKLILIDEPDRTGSHLSARLRRLEQLKASTPELIVIDQYGDQRFPAAYLATLVPEAIEQAATISSVFIPTGTGALLRAFDLDKQQNNRTWKLIPVDAEGSALFRNPPIGIRRHFSGYGNAKPTPFVRECRCIEQAMHVPDIAVARIARWLLTQAGLSVGPSSAAVTAAFLHAAFSEHAAVVGAGMPLLIFPDDGDVYGDSLFDDAWIIRQGIGRAA